MRLLMASSRMKATRCTADDTTSASTAALEESVPPSNARDQRHVDKNCAVKDDATNVMPLQTDGDDDDTGGPGKWSVDGD